jgi:type I site-specific restriction-modification system R (restriction) subunit
MSALAGESDARVLGTEHHIYPDIVLFLNGLPVVVIECKSPKVRDAIPEAIDQLLRYSEQGLLDTLHLFSRGQIVYRSRLMGCPIALRRPWA